MWEKRCSDGAVFDFSIGDSCYIKLYPFLFLNGDVFPLLLALFMGNGLVLPSEMEIKVILRI